MIRRMEWEFLSGKVATTTRDAIKMTKDTAMERCTGKMVAATKENGPMVFSMELEKWSSLMVE